MENRKSFILIIVFALWSSISLSQIINIKIYSDGNISHYMHQINDTLLYITNQEYSFESGYLLGTFKIDNKKLIIDEIDAPITIKQDVYYWDWNASRNDSMLLIEYFRSDFILGGHLIIDSLQFKVNGTTFQSEEGSIAVGSRSIEIPRPPIDNFEIELIYKNWFMATVQVSIKALDRSVLIEEQVVNSLSISLKQELLPKYIEIDGVKTMLILNELE